MHKRRVVQVGLMCLLLAIILSVGGCIPNRSQIKAEVYAVLNRLEHAMLEGNVDLILSCYADPFYFKEYTSVQPLKIFHYQYRSYLTDFFDSDGYYELYRFEKPNVYHVGSTTAGVVCDLHVIKMDYGYKKSQGTFDLDYTLVKRDGSWKIREIVSRNPVSISQTLSILGLPQEGEIQE